MLCLRIPHTCIRTYVVSRDVGHGRNAKRPRMRSAVAVGNLSEPVSRLISHRASRIATCPVVISPTAVWSVARRDFYLTLYEILASLTTLSVFSGFRYSPPWWFVEQLSSHPCPQASKKNRQRHLANNHPKHFCKRLITIAPPGRIFGQRANINQPLELVMSRNMLVRDHNVGEKFFRPACLKRFHIDSFIWLIYALNSVGTFVQEENSYVSTRHH